MTETMEPIEIKKTVKPAEKIRLNKYLAGLGLASRREIDRLTLAGKILINGSPASPGQMVDAKDDIRVNGKSVAHRAEKKVYFMLHKPPNVISSAKDGRGRKNVVQLIPCEQRIFPVGRLDLHTTGLLLLTNDGALSHKILHPGNEVYKEYLVTISGKLTREDVFLLEKGMELEDGLTLPAKVKILRNGKEESVVSISIREGRKRQIRRMFRKLKKPVLALQRIRIGELALKDLPMGEYRELTGEEVRYLYSL